ncbi:MAG: 1,4-dihydroxy-2-naphthoate polyprenyltransferase [Bacteroidales bacterium]|jgi:1,4-dihydroxy-2-naphthoate octaprenyltransferase|nr:1,4-dihydroxy-2-naphthoate polyprenyltransferase [Bacteroidales bacterium]
MKNDTSRTIKHDPECNSLRAWILASRPKTLTGAAIPVFIGSSLSFSDGSFKLIPALLCLAFAVLMQISANYINDLFDYLKGSDRSDRLGPDRACAKGWITVKAMKWGIFASVAAACLSGFFLIFYGGWGLIFAGAVCILFAFLYTAGPYPLSYYGWGDVLVLVFFGIVPVGGTYYVQTLQYTPEVAIASLACGMVIDTLLVINNFRDRETDAREGKRTIIVRMGEDFGKHFYLILGCAAAALCLTFAVSGMWPAAILPMFYLIPHVSSWKKMVKLKEGKNLNMILGETSGNMLLFGILLSLGIILS